MTNNNCNLPSSACSHHRHHHHRPYHRPRLCVNCHLSARRRPSYSYFLLVTTEPEGKRRKKGSLPSLGYRQHQLPGNKQTTNECCHQYRFTVTTTQQRCGRGTPSRAFGVGYGVLGYDDDDWCRCRIGNTERRRCVVPTTCRGGPVSDIIPKYGDRVGCVRSLVTAGISITVIDTTTTTTTTATFLCRANATQEMSHRRS